MWQSLFCNTFPLSVNIVVSMPSWNKTNRQTLQKQAKKKKERERERERDPNKGYVECWTEKEKGRNCKNTFRTCKSKQIKSAWRVIKECSQCGFKPNALWAAIFVLASIFDCFHHFQNNPVILCQPCHFTCNCWSPEKPFRTYLYTKHLQLWHLDGFSYRNHSVHPGQNLTILFWLRYFDSSTCMTHSVMLNIIN